MRTLLTSLFLTTHDAKYNTSKQCYNFVPERIMKFKQTCHQIVKSAAAAPAQQCQAAA